MKWVLNNATGHIVPVFIALFLLVGSIAESADAQVRDHQKISAVEGGFAGVLQAEDNFGYSVARLGDIDGDNVVDVAVSAPFDDDGGSGHGAVWILFLNSDGTVKSYQKISDTAGGFTGTLGDEDSFGHAVARADDLDGDGIPDLLVGANQDDDGGSNRGAVWIVLLNADGTVKDNFKISDTVGTPAGFVLENGDQFGHGVSRLGDLDGDGTPDIAGAKGHGGHLGAIWVMFLNPDFTVRDVMKITEGEGGFTGDLDEGDQLGHDLDLLGDYDGDGVQDLAAGAPFDDDGGTDRGAAYLLYLNADGTVKSHDKISQTDGGFSGVLDDGDIFGHPPVNMGDLDGDGTGDLIFGATYDDDGGDRNGAFYILFMNPDHTVRAHQKVSDLEGGFTGVLDEADIFAHSVAAIGDLDGDGFDDYLSGTPWDDDGETNAGAAYILFSDGNYPNGGGTPSASFTFSCADLTCDFTDASTDDGVIVSWDWDFGDANTSMVQNPSHTYAAGGTYTVSLTVTDDVALTDVVSQEVTVGTAPTASFTFACTDLACDFTDASTDDGVIVSWDWDFGDANTSMVQNPSHTYAAGGTYTVGLTVTDDVSLTDFTSQDVTVVGPTPPTAAFTFVCTDLTCAFTDASTDDGVVVSWDWDFGDTNTSTEQNPSHTFAAAGTYAVGLTVTDDVALTDFVSQDVTVATGVPPTASFTVTDIDLTCDFTDTSTDDGVIVSWEWDFGDTSTSTEQNPSHTYAATGTYTVVLTVTDDVALSDNTSQDITVTEGGGAGTMHVATIVVVTDRTARAAIATVTIVDENDVPVASATVDGTFSGDLSGVDTGETDANGEANLTSSGLSTRPTDLGFCVDDVVHETFTYDPAANADPAFACDTTPPPPPGDVMHVDDIATAVVRNADRTGAGEATVTILDENGVGVADATVSGTFSGDVSGTPSAVTDANGFAVLLSDPVTTRPGTTEFCVDDVTHATMTYDAEANEDPSFDCSTAGPSAAIGSTSATLSRSVLETELGHNYPNPFGVTTTISFAVQSQTDVRIEVLDILGRRVMLLVNRPYGVGRHEVVWDGRTDAGVALSSGLYFYQMQAGDFSQMRSMLLLR